MGLLCRLLIVMNTQQPEREGMDMQTTDNKNTKHYIHVAIFFILTFGIGFLPPVAQITEVGMHVLGAFVGVVYGWMFLGLSWPSIFGLIALGLSGYGSGSIDEMFISGFSFWVLPSIVMCYIFADALTQTKFTNYVADKITSVKLVAGKPFALMFLLLIGMVVMNLLYCGLAGVFLLWSISKSIAKQAGYPERNLFCTYMVVGTMVVQTFTGMIYPFEAGIITSISFLQQGLPDAQVPFVGWIVVLTVFSIVYSAVYTLVAKFILRPDFSAVAALGDSVFSEVQNTERIKMNHDQKFGLAMLLLFTGIMFVGNLLPASIGIVGIFKRLGLCGALGLVLCIMSIYKNKDGESFLSLQSACRSISWDVMWLLIATEPLSAALNSDDCGIMASITAAVMPVFSSMNNLVFLIVCTVVLGLITQIVHNLVLLAIFIPFLCPLYAQMGGDPLLMFFALVVSMNAAFATPAASWTSAIMFGEPSIVTEKTYGVALVHFVVTCVLIFAVGMPLINLLW